MHLSTKSFAATLIVIASLTLVLFPVTRAHADSEPITYPPIYDEVGAVASTSLPLVAQSPSDPWVLLHLTPDSPDTANPPISGSYFVTNQFGSAIKSKNGRFAWDLPYHVFISSGSIPKEEIFTRHSNPFRAREDGSSRYLLCQLHEEQTGANRFSNVHGVPDDWKADVAPAVAYFRVHPSLLKTDVVNATQIKQVDDALETLTRDANPYIVLTAYQLLSRMNRFDTTDMEHILSLADTRLMASVIASVSVAVWRKPDDNLQWLVRRVQTITSLDQLEGIAYGIKCSIVINGTEFIPFDYTVDVSVAPLSNDDYDADCLLMGQVRHRLQVLYNRPLSEDARAHAIDEVCRSYGN